MKAIIGIIIVGGLIYFLYEVGIITSADITAFKTEASLKADELFLKMKGWIIT